ncbi:MAG: hypothetical protein WCF36_22135 [Candidatus Nanopelagicales bacterium]
MRVLYVCTANICRSASAAQLLREAVDADVSLAGVEVRSAGTLAIPGLPGCAVAPALVGVCEEHRSQPLTRELTEWADLLLPAALDHRSAIATLNPAVRSRTFTIRQAGRIAHWLVESGMVRAAWERAERVGDERWADSFERGDPRIDVEPMPADSAARIDWLVGELDAARGMTAVVPVAGAGRESARWRLGRDRATDGDQRQRRLGSAASVGPKAGGPAGRIPRVDPSAIHPDDIPDPHVLGAGLHALAYEQLRASNDALVGLLRAVR